MKITDIKAVGIEHDLGETRAYGTARGLTSIRNATLIFVETDKEVTGIGEAWGPCNLVVAALESLKPYFIGRNIHDHNQVPPYIYSQRYHLGYQNTVTSCLGGIDIAVWDALGKNENLPVHSLIGGLHEDRIPVYASNGYFAVHPSEQLGDQLKRFRDLGYPGAKIKIGRGPEDDEKRVATARAALGDDILLMVDANGNYTSDMALQSMNRIQSYGIHFYEEPLAPTDFEGYGRLRLRSPMPIATGEALYTAQDFKRLMDINGADLWQPDLTLCGGLSVGREIFSLAKLAHVRMSPHVWGGAVGLAAALHFAASLYPWPHSDNVPFPVLLEYDRGENALRDKLLRCPIKYIDGHLQVPDGPGLGIELNWDIIEKYRIN